MTVRGHVLLSSLFAMSLSCASPAQNQRRLSVDIPLPERTPHVSRSESEMVRLEGGTFEMLAHPYPYVPARKETVAPFEIGRTEVTVGAYRACVNAGACTPPVGLRESDEPRSTPDCKEQLAAECNFARSDRETHPVNCLTFAQAERYCQYRGSRMPTEAEWEFAAFGESRRVYPWGNQEWDRSRANVCEDACHSAFSCPLSGRPRGTNDGYASTAPVGSFTNGDTPERIHDLWGNVWEWSVRASQGYSEIAGGDGQHVIRGDAWSSAYNPAYEDTTLPEVALPNIGFRCARPSQTESQSAQSRSY